MSSETEFVQDGAHEGLLASSGMQRALGIPPQLPPISADGIGRLINRAVEEADGAWPDHEGSTADYDRVSWLCAGAVLDVFRADPTTVRGDAFDVWFSVVETERWAWIADGASSPSVFQWGWATNCARRLCELPPIPNMGCSADFPVVGVQADVAELVRREKR